MLVQPQLTGVPCALKLAKQPLQSSHRGRRKQSRTEQHTANVALSASKHGQHTYHASMLPYRREQILRHLRSCLAAESWRCSPGRRVRANKVPKAAYFPLKHGLALFAPFTHDAKQVAAIVGSSNVRRRCSRIRGRQIREDARKTLDLFPQLVRCTCRYHAHMRLQSRAPAPHNACGRWLLYVHVNIRGKRKGSVMLQAVENAWDNLYSLWERLGQLVKPMSDSELYVDPSFLWRDARICFTITAAAAAHAYIPSNRGGPCFDPSCNAHRLNPLNSGRSIK